MFKGKKSEGSPTKGKKAISKLSRKGIAKYAAEKKRQPQTSRSATCPEYQATWSRASDAFAKIQKNMFSDVLDAITRFATNASPIVPSSFSGSSSSSSPSFSLIPTCALLTGVNLPDHEDLFRLLVTELRSSISPHVAAIKSSAGGTTLRAMVQTTVAQLMLIQVLLLFIDILICQIFFFWGGKLSNLDFFFCSLGRRGQ